MTAGPFPFGGYALLAMLALLDPQVSKAGEEAPVGPALGTVDRSAFVQLDEPGDGAIWARTAAYKAAFSTSGFTYIPYLGWWAPRNFPIRFTPAFVGVGEASLRTGGAPVPLRLGENRVVYDHGTFQEVYEVRAEGVEQFFVLPARVGAGDLVVHLAVETDLEFLGVEEGGHLFTAPGLGSVRYGEAIVVDARGSRHPASVTYDGGALELRVPSAVVAGAAYPLTIDPVISTFGVDTTMFDDFNVDVCFDVSAGKHVFTYEETFSATDHDVLTTTLTVNGVPGLFTYQDSTSADWRNPHNADNNLNNIVLVVADVGASPNRDIRGRRYSPAAELNLAAQFTIEGFSGDQFHSDVGGDPFLAPPTLFCVVWEEEFSTTDHDIYMRTVDPFSQALGPATALDDSLEDDRNPAIAKGNGLVGTWHVAYERIVSGTNHDIRGHQVDFDGSLPGSDFSVDSSVFDDRNPDVGGDGTTALYVYERNFVLHHDIAGTFVTGDVPGTTTNLTLNEPGASLFEDQIHPTVDTDGCRFAYAYAESYFGSPTDYDVYVAAVRDTGAGVVWDEGHVNPPNAYTSAREDRPALTSRFTAGGTGSLYVVGFDDDNLGANHDVHGAIYEAHSGALSTSVFPSACGSPAPTIAASGTTALGGSLTIATTAAQGGTLVTFFGFPGATPVCAGTGPCLVGTSFPPFIVTAGAISGPVPCDPVLVGGTISFQGAEYGLGLAGGCVFGPFGLLLTDTIDATIGY